MTHNANRMIEQQIAIELERLNSIFPDEEEKSAIIQRIAELKAMLTPETEKSTVEHKTLGDALSEIFTAWRNRHR